ncbi:acyltransferase family protein [Gulosibacter sp. GYB002]
MQGLRTIALLLVATFHVWFSRVSGGVDIFLLISAYLMTRSLTARAEVGNLTRPVSFLIRKFARLMPLSYAVALLTLVAAFLLTRVTAWPELTGDATAALSYTENFRLQAQTADYFAADRSLATPYQHYWSLAIQGQVFVIWAVVHFLVERIARGLKASIRWMLLVIFSLIFAGSLAWSVWYTEADQSLAYFDTAARLWEFAAGSLLALVQPWINLPLWLRSVMGWIGLLGVVSCGFLLPVESTFPGYAALWPVVSASLIILSADATPTRFGPDRFLASRVLERISGYTFALYLVHWPVLVYTLRINSTPEAGIRLGTLTLLISAVVSVVLVHIVERPTATWSKRGKTVTNRRRPRIQLRSLVVVVASALIGATAISAAATYSTRAVAAYHAAIEQADYSRLGANAPGNVPDLPEFLPAGTDSNNDWGIVSSNCVDIDVGLCTDSGSGSSAAERSILLVGNSHIAQLHALFDLTAGNQGDWRVRTQIATDCNYSPSFMPDYPECSELWRNAEDFIVSEQPDMVVILGTKSSTDGETLLDLMPGWVEWIKEVSPETVVVVVRDNPRFETSPLSCAARYGWDDPACQFDYTYSEDEELQQTFELSGALWVDLNPDICPDNVCPPALGGVVTYLDDNHLTKTFVYTLAGEFADQISPRVPWWPVNPYGDSPDN